MRKILISLLSIGAVAIVAVVATGAFFSDTETSRGNILQAGAIDLKIDNTCYYNGRACVESHWQGTEDRCSCTWELKDLEGGDVFFNFSDLKPGDWEEDTLSLHVFNNDAWLCADIEITEHVDNGCTDPEVEVPDPHCPNTLSEGGEGEIAQELNFIFWVDDGDNVLEEQEEIITQGPASEVLGNVRWALADSRTALLEEEGPLQGSTDYFIGKGFCYGELTPNPVPPGPNTPLEEQGFDCDGSGVGNISQTDRLAGDIIFEAVQARNNEGFLCNPPEPTPTPQ